MQETAQRRSYLFKVVPRIFGGLMSLPFGVIGAFFVSGPYWCAFLLTFAALFATKYVRSKEVNVAHGETPSTPVNDVGASSRAGVVQVARDLQLWCVNGSQLLLMMRHAVLTFCIAPTLMSFSFAHVEWATGVVSFTGALLSIVATGFVGKAWAKGYGGHTLACALAVSPILSLAMGFSATPLQFSVAVVPMVSVLFCTYSIAISSFFAKHIKCHYHRTAYSACAFNTNMGHLGRLIGYPVASLVFEKGHLEGAAVVFAIEVICVVLLVPALCSRSQSQA